MTQQDTGSEACCARKASPPQSLDSERAEAALAAVQCTEHLGSPAGLELQGSTLTTVWGGVSWTPYCSPVPGHLQGPWGASSSQATLRSWEVHGDDAGDICVPGRAPVTSTKDDRLSLEAGA